MESAQLLEIISRGEDSTHQFKQNINNAESLAADMVAFSNGSGGMIIIGVNDNSTIIGLNNKDIHRLNQLISNTASQHVQPIINLVTENIKIDNKLIMIIKISPGVNKPYQDKNGIFWVKSGADKRKATSREEIQRIFQKANLIHADELPVSGMTIEDLDLDYFKLFFQKRYDVPFDTQNVPLSQLLKNMKLLEDDYLTLGAVLLFSKSIYNKIPFSIVKAGAFDTLTIATDTYLDSRDFYGKLADIFQETVHFIVSNLHHVQGNQDVNSIGIPEIPREAIQEIVANALIHRDYFVSAPVRVFVFQDRIEIISPGHLPNNLSVENIKKGTSVPRNPVLASYANHLIPYRGYGSGIIRALKIWPDIDFQDDREGNFFKVTIKRCLNH